MFLRFFLPSHASCEDSEQNREQGEPVTENRISFSPRLPLGLSPPPGGFEQESSRSSRGTPETGPSPAPAVPTAPQRPDTPLGFVQTGPGGGRVSVPQPNRWDFRQVTRRNQLTERAKETCEQ